MKHRTISQENVIGRTEQLWEAAAKVASVRALTFLVWFSIKIVAESCCVLVLTELVPGPKAHQQKILFFVIFFVIFSLSWLPVAMYGNTLFVASLAGDEGMMVALEGCGVIVWSLRMTDPTICASN